MDLGGRGNATLAAAINTVDPTLINPLDRYDNRYLSLTGTHPDVALSQALAEVRDRFGDDLTGVPYEVDDDAVDGLKFADLLPAHLAAQTLAARAVDPAGAAQVARSPNARSRSSAPTRHPET